MTIPEDFHDDLDDEEWADDEDFYEYSEENWDEDD